MTSLCKLTKGLPQVCENNVTNCIAELDNNGGKYLVGLPVLERSAGFTHATFMVTKTQN